MPAQGKDKMGQSKPIFLSVIKTFFVASKAELNTQAVLLHLGLYYDTREY
jgi:hypothetical protein